MTAYDAIVVGGGLVGAAIAYGLQRQGCATLMLDEGDVAFRAARGNFGLVWVQSKGVDFAPYAQWTWKSAESWAALSREIEEATGITLDYQRPGGVEICLDLVDFETKDQEMQNLKSHAGHIKYEMLDRKALVELLPGLGPDVLGGCYSSADGHVNPLALLRGLHAALRNRGGTIVSGERVSVIDAQNGAFTVSTTKSRYSSDRLVIAAGLGTQRLAAMVGLDIPVRPVRGQNLITEKVGHFLKYPMATIRQTTEGSVQIGASEEEAGYDEGTTPDVLRRLGNRAVRIFPHLKQARVVRTWGALRTMTPDGYPIYAQSKTCPGAFAAVCHSGVTLAATHVLDLARSIAENNLPDMVLPMGAERLADAPD
jgi:glycine/D-amino acid oxidase-like deaminating enzyme